MINIVSVLIHAGRAGQNVGVFELITLPEAFLFRKAPVIRFFKGALPALVRGIFFLEDADAGGKAGGGQNKVSSHIQCSAFSVFQDMSPFTGLIRIKRVLQCSVIRQGRRGEICQVFLGQIQFLSVFLGKFRRCQPQTAQDTDFTGRNGAEGPAGSPGILHFDRRDQSIIPQIIFLREMI